MEKKVVLIIGLEKKEISAIRQNIGFEFILLHHDMLPNVKLIEGELFVESLTIMDKFFKVDQVIFHGIFGDDFDFITLLALWNGPCLPNAHGMLDLRLRIPGLTKALQVTKFGGIKRGMTIGQQKFSSDKEVVAKWGVWHCGDDKHKFSGDWTSSETSVVEDFIHGEAVRIMIVGRKHWQIKLTGDSWLKSIHNEGAWEMELDPELLEDSKRIAKHFKLETVGVDYMVGHDGTRYLLEVNHIPNVTVFPFVNKVFLNYVTKWTKSRK
jgi:hypothetical protein